MKSFYQYNIEKLKNPEDAALYLTEALISFYEDDDIESFIAAINDVREVNAAPRPQAKVLNFFRSTT
jgi:hypothetical protein